MKKIILILLATISLFAKNPFVDAIKEDQNITKVHLAINTYVPISGFHEIDLIGSDGYGYKAKVQADVKKGKVLAHIYKRCNRTECQDVDFYAVDKMYKNPPENCDLLGFIGRYKQIKEFGQIIPALIIDKKTETVLVSEDVFNELSERTIIVKEKNIKNN
jgi:hypothetical protein